VTAEPAGPPAPLPRHGTTATGLTFDSAGRALAGGLPPSLPEHIAHVLERDIVEGRLAPGERVTEEELALRVGVSRTPVREAMRMLEGQGLIVRHRDRGVFVAQRTRRDEAAAIYELRVALEGHLAAKAAQHLTPGELDAAWRLHHEFQRRLRTATGDAGPGLVAVDSDLHWTIYHGARSDLVSVVASYWGRLQRELYDPVYRNDPEVFAAQHERILQALAAHDSEAAQAAVGDHIRSGWRAITAAYGDADTVAAPVPQTGAPRVDDRDRRP
jgi:DNA-binding GntR family transcriptional regulator